MEHAGQNRGWTSRVLQQPYHSYSESSPSLQLTGGASTPESERESDGTADHCGPPSFRPPVLVILLLRGGGYLFLHQPQLVAQVAVGFHEMLDLGLRGRERVFHLHVFLHSNGAIWEVRVQALLERGVKRVKESRERGTVSFRILIWGTAIPQYLGPISFAGGDLLICILIRRHTVVVRLVIVLAIATMPDSHTLQDKLNIVWNEGTQSGKDTVHLCFTSYSVRFWSEVKIRCWPLGLVTEFPSCLRLASLNMSITRVANSCALNLASFCLP